MAESSVSDTPENTAAAKGHFAKAIEEAKAGAQALGKEAQDRADLYRNKATERGNDWLNEAKSRGGEAKDRATELAEQGKAGASRAMSTIGKMVDENAPLLDEKVGVKYGDYARQAARSIQGAADRLDEKELGELAEDAKEFVRKSPGLAVGLAAVAGFMLARLFSGGSKE